MRSPAQRHRERELAKLIAGSAQAGKVLASGTIYDQMLAKLLTDMRRLKDIQSIERKIEVKATLVAEYDDYIDGVLLGGSGAQDEVVATLCVWNIDVGRFARALEIGAYLIAHGVQLPVRYTRNVQTTLIDEIGGALLAGKVSDSKLMYEIADTTERLTHGHDAPDQARAKLHKAMGMALLQLCGDDLTENTKAYAERALAQFTRATELNPAAGVKKQIERLQSRLNSFAGSAG
jgi:hypothetical protein